MVGQLSSSNDQDWFSISTSGAAIIDVKFTENISSGYYWYISVQNNSGEVLSKVMHFSSQTTTQFSTAVSQGGEYFVIITTTSWSGADYTLTVTFPMTSCPDCSGTAVTLTNVTFPKNMTCECIGTTSITIGSGVTIPNGATVTFKAPIINVKPGFHAEPGAVVNMRQD